MRILQFLTIVVVLGTSLPLGLAQDSSTFRTLYTFAGGSDGAKPSAGLTGQNGVLYGTTYIGGTGNNGPVFSLTRPASPGGAWAQTVLYTFTGDPDGSSPSVLSGVVIDTSGVLYGTTQYGGIGYGGTVFSLTPPASPGGAWTETVLHDFAGGSDGAQPYAGVVIGKSGVLYGTTDQGGTGTCRSVGCGTVFSLTPPASPEGAWTETVLHSFTFSYVAQPSAGGVVIDTSGVLYGTTQGANGAVFSLTPPASPGGAWGTTNGGGTGTCECGTVFALRP